MERELWNVWRPKFGWQSLCPIIFADRLGIVVVMPWAEQSASAEEAEAIDADEYPGTTAEGKPDDYRRLHGRIVACDYGLADAVSVRERRDYYRLASVPR